MIRYLTPADAPPPGADGTGQGVGAHRDTGFLSFVHQDDVGGLQVERDGRLIDVAAAARAPSSSTSARCSSSSPGATTRRPCTGSSARRPGVERISLAYFFNPKLEATLAPVDLPPHLAALAPGGDSDDPDNPILANYGDNSLKVRLRAHPDVAAVHHADLLAAGTWTRRRRLTRRVGRSAGSTGRYRGTRPHEEAAVRHGHRRRAGVAVRSRRRLAAS